MYQHAECKIKEVHIMYPDDDDDEDMFCCQSGRLIN